MASTTTPADPGANISRSKKLPWFQTKIGSSLTPAGRKLLEEYSHIEPSDIENHIYKIRDEAWEIFPWPCVGEFWFVALGLSLHPSYPALLSRLRSAPPTTKFLDLGTCLGQDVRKLIFDGVSPHLLYGSDIFAEYERVGHDLFCDAGTYQNHFIAADVLDDAVDGPLTETWGTWDIISIYMFLHIWDWDTQILTCKRILALLKREAGSMIIGAQTASTKPGAQAVKPPFVAEGEERSIYRQSKETFVEMWKIVEKDEGVRLKVNVEYEEQKEQEVRVMEEEKDKKKKFFTGPEQRRLFFTVEIL